MRWSEGPLVIDLLLKDPSFSKSVACAALRAKPLGFVHVGARGGIHEWVEPAAGITAVLGFSFYGFPNLFYRSRKQPSWATAISRWHCTTLRRDIPFIVRLKRTDSEVEQVLSAIKRFRPKASTTAPS